VLSAIFSFLPLAASSLRKGEASSRPIMARDRDENVGSGNGEKPDRSDISDEAKAQYEAAADETRALTDEQVRERIVQLAFGGDGARYDAFVDALRRAIPPDVSVILRGSAVVGRRWVNGRPFDADGPGTSDLDIALVGGEMIKLWDADRMYIPRLHTAPLDDEAPNAAPALVPLRRALCTIARRQVNIQATSNLVQYARDVLFDQPYFTLLDKGDRDDERPAWEREVARKKEALEREGER
jgi:hypothetical protein